jgi:alkylation response protein AidB-like acyl-CoA dehydrogenase
MTSCVAREKSTTDLFEVVELLAADFANRAALHDKDNSFPFENFEALHKAQLLSLTVPTEFCGSSVNYTTVACVIERIASGDASTALVLTMHYLQHLNAARTRRWNPTVYERLCRESVQGIALINAARVEPELGTPARGGLPATVAKRTSDGWQVTGHKQYTTGSPILRYFVVWACTDDSEPRVGNFLIPSNSSGVKILETWDHLGMRATGSHDLILDNVWIPAEYALDVRLPKAWTPVDPLTMAGNSLLLSALYQGVATAARDWLVDYLHQRSPTNLNASLATLPRFQTSVGEIEALLYANHRLIYTLASDLDQGEYDTNTINLQAQTVKYLATNNAIRSVESALKLIGNPGLFKTNPLERHYRDVLCSRIHTPQDDAICLALGKSALRLS